MIQDLTNNRSLSRMSKVFCLLAVTWGGPAAANMVADCEQETNYDLRIAACSRMIEQRDTLYTKDRAGIRNLAISYTNRGAGHIGKRQLDSAISDATKAIELDSAHVNAYGVRGTAYAIKKQFAEAMADLDQALTMKPTGGLLTTLLRHRALVL